MERGIDRRESELDEGRTGSDGGRCVERGHVCLDDRAYAMAIHVVDAAVHAC